MSGGVDSAVAALRCAQRGETVAVTLELWADAENDAERSCCSATAVAQARALAHSMGLPHFTLDLRAEFRDGVVEPFIAGYADGETPNPCVGCNGHVRLDAMLEFADAARRDAARDRPLRADAERGTAPAAAARRRRSRQGSDLHARRARPASLARLRFPLGELTKPEVRELAAEAGLPVAAKADSQDLCFLAGHRPRPASSRVTAGSATGPGRSSTTTAACSATTSASTASRSASARARRDRRRADVRARQGRGINRVMVGPAQRCRRRTVTVRSARLHRDGARVNRVKLRYRSKPLRARVADAAPGRHASLTLELDRRRRRRRAGSAGVPDGRRPGGRLGHDHASPPPTTPSPAS